MLMFLFCLVSCGGDDGGPADPPVDAAGTCVSLKDPQAKKGDPVGTYADVAMPFLQNNCLRCHDSSKVGTARMGAPDALNWNVEATVRANLSQIRNAVGVVQTMPNNAPKPSCDDRLKLIKWIDAEAP